MTDTGHHSDPTIIVATEVRGQQDGSLTRLEGLRQQLLRQLNELPGHEKRWALVIDFADREGYVQFLGSPDGSLRCECQSNLNRPADGLLQASDEDQLVQLGWHHPDPPKYPNWYNVVSSGDGTAVGVAATRAITTLGSIFGATEGDDLKVRLFSLSGSGDNRTTVDTSDNDTPSELATRSPRTAPRSRAIVIARSGDRVRVVTSPGELLVEAADARALVEVVQQLDENPLKLARGSAVTLFLPTAEREIILMAIEPDDSLTDELYEKQGKLEEDEAFTELAPISARNRIDDQRWGWVPLIDMWGDESTTRHFGIFPIGRATELARFNAWMSASMTGAVISSGLRCRGVHAVVWVDNDSEPDTANIYYEVDDFDDVLRNVFSWDGYPICPVCDESEPSGWEVDVSVSPIFSGVAVGNALTQVWEPCSKHESRTTKLEAAGRSWRWIRHQWEPGAQSRARRSGR